MINKNPADNEGYTPLHIAAQQGHLNVCKLIIENVIVKNPSSDKGETPLSLATQYSHEKVCKLFTKRKTLDVNTVQKAKVAKK